MLEDLVEKDESFWIWDEVYNQTSLAEIVQLYYEK